MKNSRSLSGFGIEKLGRKYHSKVQPSRRKQAARCGHFKQVKVRGKWKCVACGQILTVEESMQNSIELSEVITSTIVTGRPLSESLDDVLGRKEWNALLAKIPTKGRLPKRRHE